MLILANWKDYSNTNMQAILEGDTRDRKISEGGKNTVEKWRKVKL